MPRGKGKVEAQKYPSLLQLSLRDTLYYLNIKFIKEHKAKLFPHPKPAAGAPKLSMPKKGHTSQSKPLLKQVTSRQPVTLS